MGTRRQAHPDAATLAESVALLEVARMDATIRPLDYEPHDTFRSGDRTLEGELPIVTLSEPRVHETETSGSDAPLEMIGLLGEGGMGRVLLAKQRSLGREVAVKVLKAVPSGSEARALVHEGRLLGSVEHPNVLPIHALGSDELGRPALVMKRIDGVAWRDLILDRDHPFWSEVQTIAKDRLGAHLEILMHIAQAVHFAHQRGVLHRDIKSDNVIVGRFGEVCLADWGIAIRKKELGGERARVIGTPSHLAPEMARGDFTSIDERTDVYLLGSTLHEVLCDGRPRHPGAQLVTVLCSAMESLPVEYAATVPSELAAACNRATSKERSDRFPTALAFRDAIADYLRHASSVLLAQATGERKGELFSLIASSAASDGPARDAIYRLLSECRFGFRQAIREWPDNVDAFEQLRECILGVARFELASRRLDAARALLSEVNDPPSELVERLAEYEAQERSAHARKEELERLSRDVDLTLSASQYAWFFGGLGTLIAALAFTILVLRSRGYRLDPLGLTILAGGALAVLLVAVVLKRRTLFDRRASRGVVGLLVAGFTGVFCGRAVAVLDGSVATQMNNANSILVGACCLAGAFLLRPWFAWLAPLFLLAAIGGSQWPREAGMFFLTAVAIATAMAAWFWKRDQRRERSNDR